MDTINMNFNNIIINPILLKKTQKYFNKKLVAQWNIKLPTMLFGSLHKKNKDTKLISIESS